MNNLIRINIFILFTCIIKASNIVYQYLQPSYDTYDIFLYLQNNGIMKDFELDMSIDFTWTGLNVFRSWITQQPEIHNLSLENKNIEGELCKGNYILNENNITLNDFPFYYIPDKNLLQQFDSIPLKYKFKNESFSIVHHLYNNYHISHRSFSIYINNKESISIIYFGGIPQNILNQYKYKTSIKVRQDYSTWGCTLHKVNISLYSYTVNGYVSFQSNINTTYVPSTFMYYLRNTIFSRYILNKSCEMITYTNPQKFVCLCSMLYDFPDVWFHIENVALSLTKDDLFTPGSFEKCIFLMQWKKDFSAGWELGLPFLTKYLTNFDYDNSLITFHSNEQFEFHYEYGYNDFSLEYKNLCFLMIIFISILQSFFIIYLLYYRYYMKK